MSTSPLLPRAQASIVSGQGIPTREFYNFLLSLAASTSDEALQAQITALAARVAALEDEEGTDATIQGFNSVRVDGTLAGGAVIITLQGDVEDPGLTFYYGTNAAGEKGWYAVSDTLAQGDGIALTVNADGTTTIAHRDTSAVTDISATFTGSTVLGELSFTYDQFGHVLTRTISGRQLDHNELNDIQGGNVTERYHFTAAEHAGLLPWAGETPGDYALITQSITDGDTTHAPSGDAVYEALVAPNQLITGQEYLYAFHTKLMAGTSAKMVFSGDSTTEGGPGHATGDYLINVAVLNQGLRRGHKLTSVNSGHSSAHTGDWVSTYLAPDLALLPDLYVVRWGLNDPFYGRDIAQFTASLNSGLATIRASYTVAQMSILLMVPSTANDPPNGRDAAWLRQVRKVVRQSAIDYECAFIDTYTLWSDAIHAAGRWMDNPFGDGRAIHPMNVMNGWIGTEISRFVFPDVLNPPNFGTYTPTITHVANVTSTTAQVCQWCRTGNVVTVSGRVDIQPTAAAGAFTHINLSLPVPSDLTTVGQLAGAGGHGSNPYITALISPVTATDRASLSFYASETVMRACLFNFTYLVA